MQIIVPIYNAFEVVKPALLSLKQHNLNDDVLLINDASTDTRIKSLLNEMPKQWQVQHNQVNLGFVRTANIGLKKSSSHSILLNSDTLVTTAWLDRFKQAIEGCQDIGTATPWSNNAEICSLPQTLKANPIPQSIDELAQQLANKHQPVYPELPTAVGFCMLISAAAKQQVGLFDEATFGWGYGEENDYSLRVSQAGLRNVLVDNCYVAHVGNQSFKEKDLRPNEETMQRLLKKHPDYLQMIQKFIEKDPLAATRKSIIAKIGAF